MDDDDVDLMTASIAWFDDTAFVAQDLHVESTDFGLLTGDVVPRDGLQRPLLTSGSPTHAPVPRRASEQPIHITHVHQTVIQNCGPVATACPTTMAESTSGLSCLEAALSVSQGSVYRPASRWRHRNKLCVQVAAGVAPHVHDGAMAFGTSMPAEMHTPSSDVAAMDDDLDLLAMPAVAHVHTTDGLMMAAPSIPQHVRDVMARVRLQQHEQSRSNTECAPTVPPPVVQASGGPVVEAIARHFAVKAERSESARTSVQAERDGCYATARLLANAGWHERAEAVITAAPNPAHTTAPLPPALDRVVSLDSAADCS